MPYKQTPKSAALKALVGKQKNLPEALREKILAAPETPAKQTNPATEKRKQNKKAKAEAQENNLSKNGRKYKISYQKSRDKKSRAAEAKRRHDTAMMATGRGDLVKKNKCNKCN